VMFFTIVGILIVLNLFLYFFISHLPYNLFVAGFPLGLFVAKIFIMIGY
jgi:hypothetical protein